MNYKKVKKNKKNTGLILVASILALILAGGAVAGIGYAFDWWKTEDASTLPTSTYNVNVSCIDDILGVEIKEADFAYMMDENFFYEQELQQWEANGADEENKPEAPEYFVNYGNVILNVDYFGQEFEAPADGLYDITFKVNGEEYVVEDIAFELENEKGFALMFTVDFETGKLSDANVMEGDINGFGLMLADSAMVSQEAALEGDAFSIMICYYDTESDFESFELVKFEKVAELPTDAE